MEKQFVCPVDKRVFKTRSALTQHRTDAHGTGPKAPPKRKRTKVRSEVVSAPVSKGMKVTTRPTDSARLSGVDRLVSVDLKTSGQKTGAILASVLISPGAFKRLRVVAQAYQRIRYHSLRFRVEPKMSTAVAGGYVAGFIRDPDDQVVEIDQLMSQRGTVATKWWQDAVVDGTPPNTLFYTSQGVEARQYSPGIFMLMVDGAPTQNGSLTVYCEWSVSLESPSLETPKSVSPTYSAKVNWWIRNGHQGLWWKKTASDWSSIATDLIQGPVAAGDWFILDVPLIIDPATGKAQTYWWIYVQDINTVLPDRDGPSGGGADAEAFAYDALSLPAGKLLRKLDKPEVSGECQEPSSSDMQTTTAPKEVSPSSSSVSQSLIALCTRLLELELDRRKPSRQSASQLMDSATESPGSLGISVLQEYSSLMGYQVISAPPSEH